MFAFRKLFGRESKNKIHKKENSLHQIALELYTYGCLTTNMMPKQNKLVIYHNNINTIGFIQTICNVSTITTNDINRLRRKKIYAKPVFLKNTRMH